MKPLTVLYGTETGTARDMAERIASLAVSTGFAGVGWDAMDAVPVSSWASLGGPVVLVCSTTGQGDTPATMQNTWATLLQVDCPRLDGVDFAVFGLGDSTYAKFNFQAKMLHNRLVQLGGRPIVHRGLGDEQDGNGHDDALSPWLVELWPELAAACAAGDDHVPDGVRTEFHTFKLEQQPAGSENPVTMAFVSSLVANVIDPDTPAAVAAAAAPPPTMTTTKPSSYDMKVKAVTRLTAESHFQTVSQIDFERPSGLVFEPTDAIGLTPANEDADVAYFTARYGDVMVDVRPNTEVYRRQPAVHAAGSRVRPLSTILRDCYDLAAPARRSLMLVLANLATDPDEVERFTELATVVPEYDRFCWREKRTTVEVLQDFPYLKPTLAQLLSTLTPMQPRWYSVASDPADEDTVSLCVALLEFVTPFKRQRYGTCSRQLVDSKPGSTVWKGVQLRKGQGIRWPTSASADKRAPIVLIGPGTGIAPCRALWHAALRKPNLDVTVYTGNRDRAMDFLYGEELAKLSEGGSGDGSFKHRMALSRETPAYPSRYVQHALAKEASEIAAVLRHPEGVIFISGNAKRMPQDVEDTLVAIVDQALPEHAAAGTAKFVRMLKQSGRLVMDTWA